MCIFELLFYNHNNHFFRNQNQMQPDNRVAYQHTGGAAKVVGEASSLLLKGLI